MGQARTDAGSRLVVVLSLAFAAALGIPVTGCGSSSSGSHGGTVGSGCTSNSDCANGLFCYSGGTTSAGTEVFNHLCTMTCYVTTSDPCPEKYPNTECTIGGVCVARCGNGLTCASGSACDPTYNECFGPG
jgi:hypothetical protein